MLINLGVLLLGGVFGFLLKLLIRQKRTTDNRLIITLSLLFAFCGVCSLLDISPLLGCMSMGMVYRNLGEDDGLFKQMNYFSPPVLLLFFVRSGILFDLGGLGLTIDEIELNTAYVNSGLSAYTVSLSIKDAQLQNTRPMGRSSKPCAAWSI